MSPIYKLGSSASTYKGSISETTTSSSEAASAGAHTDRQTASTDAANTSAYLPGAPVTGGASGAGRGPPSAELVVVVRTFEGHVEALCAKKPEDWRDFVGMLSDTLEMPAAELRTFRFFRQTGRLRDTDREPIGPASWADVAPDSTVVVEPPGPLPDGFRVDDVDRHVELRDTLPRDTTINVNRVADDECQTFEVNLNWTVRALMIEIESNMNIPQHRQRLVHAAKVLQFDETLRCYDVQEGSTIFVVLSC
ncbi:hypothetical protein RB595_002541 [Gaeumannomyces hyphopodioides]